MRGERGFTVVEVVVAVLVLAVGLLGLASTAALTTRMIGQGQRFSEASALATQRFETLRSQSCTGMSGGTETQGAFTVSWTVTDPGTPNPARAVQVVVTSPQAARGERADTFSTVIPC